MELKEQKALFSLVAMVFAVLLLFAFVLAIFTVDEFDRLLMRNYMALFGLGYAVCYCQVLHVKIQIIEKETDSSKV